MQTWTRLLTGTGAATEPALLRDKAGVLHIVWRGAKGNPIHGALAADGTLSGTPTAIGPAATIVDSAPSLIAGPEQSLQVLFASKDELHTLVSKDAGVKWDASPPTALASPVFAVAADKDGKPLVISAAGGTIKLLAETVQDGECCIDRAALALDAESAEAWAAWHGTGAKGLGLFAKAVKPSAGKAQPAPGSRLATLQRRLALSPRIAAPGVYLAYVAGYPAAREVKLWNVRGGEALTVARAPGARSVWIAPGPDGRLWILWLNAGGAVSAVRANKSLLRFSRPYVLGSPGGAAAVPDVVAEGSKGPLDVIAGTFHTRVLPELELTVSPAGVRVSDLGDPLEDVKVEIDGKTIKTDAKGLAAYAMAVGSTPVVKAALAGYAPATLAPPPAARRGAR